MNKKDDLYLDLPADTTAEEAPPKQEETLPKKTRNITPRAAVNKRMQPTSLNTGSFKVGNGKSYLEAPFSYNSTEAENVSLASGTLRHTVTDFVLPGKNGFDLAITRMYDSENAGIAYMSGWNYMFRATGTYPRVNNHNPLLYQLGYGWSLQLPSLEVMADMVPYGDLSVPDIAGSVYAERFYLHLEDGRNLPVQRTSLEDWKLYDYSMQDVSLVRKKDTITHPCNSALKQSYDFIVTYKNGNKDYFRRETASGQWDGHTFRMPLCARQDRFGNTILFDMQRENGMVIYDSWGRKIALVKNGNTLTWLLPDGNHIRYTVEGVLLGSLTSVSDIPKYAQMNPQRLTKVEDQAGRTTTYEYEAHTDYICYCRYDDASYGNNFAYLHLSKITHPTGAVTEYTYGRGHNAVKKDDYLEIKLNNKGGYRRYYPILQRRDIADGHSYNTIRYDYALSGDGMYIETATATRLNGVVDRHTFNDKGQMIRNETRHNGALTASGAYAYGTDAKAPDYKLIVREENKTHDPANEGHVLSKITAWQYSADKLCNPIKITETYPQNTALNQETTFQYGSYSQQIERSTWKDSNTLLIERNILRTAPDNKVVEFRQLLEKKNDTESLKEKTQYLYGTGANDAYCVVEERRFYTGENEDLAHSSQYRATTYGYNSGKYTHQPVSVRIHGLTDADGAALADITTLSDYDVMGRRISHTDSLGNTVDTAYDALGRVLNEVQPAVDGVRHSVSYYYSDQGKFITQTDENGYKTRTTYTPLGQPALTEAVATDAGMDENTSLTRLFYDAGFRLTAEETFGSNCETRTRTEYTYDTFDRIVTKFVRETGYRETHTYQNVFEDAYSRHQIVVEGDGYEPNKTTATVANQAGHVIRETLADTVTAINAYDKMGHKTSTTDAAGNTTHFELDFAGRALSTRRQVGGITLVSTTAYDALGNKIASVDCMGNKTTFTYNAAGQMIRQATPFDERTALTKYTYDAAGRLVEQKVLCPRPGAAESWKETRHVYDARGRQRETYQYEDAGRTKWNCTRFLYDGKGQKTEIQTGITHHTADYTSVRYTYNRFGNVLSITDALGQRESYTYDETGLLLTKTDRNGTQIRYQHDCMGRLTSEEVSAADERGVVTTRRNTLYTKTGQKASATMTETAGGRQVLLTTRFTYNNKGQLQTQTEPDGVEKRYTYDSRGNRESFMLLRNGAAQIHLFYQYDEASRLVRVRNSGPAGTVLAEYSYNANGSRTRTWYPESRTEATYQYNRGGLVTRLTNKQDGRIISQFDYTYCLDGNQASKTQPDSTTLYHYDKMGRLVEEDDSKFSRITYQYDRFHNRAQMQVQPKGVQIDKPSTTVYYYDRNNRLLKEVKTGDGFTETLHYKYDKCGNQIYREWEGTGPKIKAQRSQFDFIRENREDGTSVLDIRQYNGFGQLIRAWRDTLDIHYTYRPDGLRHQKTVRNMLRHNTAHTIHHWDGQNMVMETTGTGSAIKARYLRGASLIAQQIDGTLWYYTHNAHGDVVQRTRHNGSATPQYQYDAFGNQREPAERDPNPFRYCGEYWDAELGEVYLRARTYNPANGRFTSEDPARSGSNWYGYCGGDPIANIDPAGLFFKKLWNGVKKVANKVANTVKVAVAVTVNRVVETVKTVTKVVKTAVNFALGLVAGAIETVTFGATSKSLDYNNTAYTAGRVVGNITTGAFVGAAGLIGGTAIGGGGTVASGGALVVPAVAVGSAVAAGGIAVAASGANAAARNLQQLTSMAKSTNEGSSSNSNNNWANERTIQDHFDRHGSDFNAKTPEEYTRMANDFYNEREAYQVKVDEEGVVRVYDPQTNTFGSYNPDGTTKTFFKPSAGQAYFDRQ